MRVDNSLRGALLVLLAAGLWGTLGTLYTWGHAEFGLSLVTIVFWRAALAALSLGGGLTVLRIAYFVLRRGDRLEGSATQARNARNTKYAIRSTKYAISLKVRLTDLPVFATFGLLGVTAFYLLYIYSVALVGVAVAVVLLYTAPVFVALMAWRWLGEGFGPRKAAALALTLLGCALVARAYDPALLQVNLAGILCGLGSAITYALYSILGKVSLSRGYPIAGMSLYVYGIGAAGLLVVAAFLGPQQLFAVGTNPERALQAWGLLLIIALAQTLGALWAYTAGLRHLDASVASILATFEPVVATALAYFVLHEPIAWPQVAGGGLILAAVLLLRPTS